MSPVLARDAEGYPLARSTPSLFALVVQRLEYGGQLLTFSRIWIEFSQPIHDPYVVGPDLMFNAIKLHAKSIELLRVVLLLSFFHLFVELTEFTIGFQLGLIATDCLNEFLHILDCPRRLVRFIYLRKRRDRCSDQDCHSCKELQGHWLYPFSVELAVTARR